MAQKTLSDFGSKKKTKAKKKSPPESLGQFAGRYERHQRTGAKFRVVMFNRDTKNRAFRIADNSKQFATLGDAKEYATYYSAKNDDNVYVVLGTSDYQKVIKAAYTNGKVNESLTRSFIEYYGKKIGAKQAQDDTFLKMPK